MTADERLTDTNVLVHAYVLLDARKRAIAEALVLSIWQEGGGLTTMQNLCEFFAVATRKIERPMPVDRAGHIVKEVLRSAKWRVLDRNQLTLEQGIDLVMIHHTPFWDSLIAACMLEHGITTIVTENDGISKRFPASP